LDTRQNGSGNRIISKKPLFNILLNVLGLAEPRVEGRPQHVSCWSWPTTDVGARDRTVTEDVDAHVDVWDFVR
jgi:hypothetical protein